MVLNFKYKTLRHSDGTVSKVPLIPIALVGRVGIEAIGVIDSGAHSCVVPYSLAESLALNLSGKKGTSFGIGGKVSSIETRVLLIIKQGNEKYKFTIPVDVILSEETFPVLLGQESFFDKFIIKFNKHKEKFSLKRVRRRLF